MSLSRPQMTLTGNLTEDPRTLGEEPLRVKFGIGTNPRRRDQASGEWVPDGDAQFYDVICFGSLARNVCESLRKGEPVVVVGTLKVKAYERTNGQQAVGSEIRADVIGPDLDWGTTHFRKTRRAAAGAAPAAAEPDGPEAEQAPDLDEQRVDVRTGELLDA